VATIILSIYFGIYFLCTCLCLLSFNPSLSTQHFNHFYYAFRGLVDSTSLPQISCSKVRVTVNLSPWGQWRRLHWAWDTSPTYTNGWAGHGGAQWVEQQTRNWPSRMCHWHSANALTKKVEGHDQKNWGALRLTGAPFQIRSVATARRPNEVNWTWDGKCHPQSDSTRLPAPVTVYIAK